MVWTGPPAAEVHDAFMNTFGMKCMVDCDIFAHADEVANIRKEFRSLATRRCKWLRDDFVADEDTFLRLLCPSYKAIFMDLKKKGNNSGNHGFCGDITQTSSRHRHGKFLPTLCRNTELWSFSQGHYYTSAELETSQGWPSLPPASRWASCMSTRVAQLPISQRRQMRGNIVHVGAYMAFLLWCSRHTSRRDGQLHGFAFGWQPFCETPPEAAADDPAAADGQADREEEKADKDSALTRGPTRGRICRSRSGAFFA